MEPSRMQEAIRFFWMNNFFMYIRGPFKKASPVKMLNIHNVKSITNFEGASTIVNSVIVQSKSKRPETANDMTALA
jgi:hypothetical protein